MSLIGGVDPVLILVAHAAVNDFRLNYKVAYKRGCDVGTQKDISVNCELCYKVFSHFGRVRSVFADRTGQNCLLFGKRIDTGIYILTYRQRP